MTLGIEDLLEQLLVKLMAEIGQSNQLSAGDLGAFQMTGHIEKLDASLF